MSCRSRRMIALLIPLSTPRERTTSGLSSSSPILGALRVSSVRTELWSKREEMQMETTRWSISWTLIVQIFSFGIQLTKARSWWAMVDTHPCSSSRSCNWVDRFFGNHAGQVLCANVLQPPVLFLLLLSFFALDGWRNEWTIKRLTKQIDEKARSPMLII